MAKRDYLSRHIAIINRLRKSPATLEEITVCVIRDAEENGNQQKFSPRTFQRDIADILAIHKLNIQFDFSAKVYKIEDDGQQELSIRTLEALQMFNALKVSDSLSQYIHFENRKPQGTAYFQPLLQAVKKRLLIQLIYQKFWESKPVERTLEPYALKECKSRWYLVARDPHDGYIKTYGLDRILSIETTRVKFEMKKTIDIEALFKHCFGVINPANGNPQNVVLSFSPEQGKYIKSLPLHTSQNILADNEDELRIELNMHPTLDFVMEILSHGEDVEVISPSALREEICKKYAVALTQY
jgi:predicted DNA-binding transcriptional regulator YafY